MAAKTVMAGLITGTMFLLPTIWAYSFASPGRQEKVALATACVIPFGQFWTVSSTANFSGQWNNIFIRNAATIALAASNLANVTPKE